jgi:hypothetical protein
MSARVRPGGGAWHFRAGGADAVITAPPRATIRHQAALMSRKRGDRSGGVVGLSFHGLIYEKELTFQVSCCTAQRYDEKYEQVGGLPIGVCALD